MNMLLIILTLWITSAVIRSAKETKRKRAEQKRSEDLKRMTAEWRAQKAQAELETKRMIEIERELVNTVTSKYWWIYQLGQTEKEWEEWWLNGDGSLKTQD